MRALALAVLDDRGRYVRDITESEFYRYEAWDVRFFTGSNLVFALLPALWFTFVRPRLRREDQASLTPGRGGLRGPSSG
jgi:hypothetical protein